MSSPRPFELDAQAQQKISNINYQCWWLALLEVARATSKLDPIFHSGGKLYAYYVTGEKAIPEEGKVPANVKEDDPWFTGLITKDFDWEQLKKQMVYGPEWQRMVMFFLWDKDNRCPWKAPRDTCNTSGRAAELELLLRYLGVVGITFGIPKVLTVPSTVRTNVNGLQKGQRLLVDKKNHAMSGVVEENTATWNRINIFNQATGNSFACKVRVDPADGQLKLMSENLTGNTVITWMLPLTIT